MKLPHMMTVGEGLITHDSVTGTAVPDFKVAVIVTVPELPA